MKMYRLCFGKIEPREITRETPKKVFFRDNRYNREVGELKDTSDYYSWHKTFEDAKQYLINKKKKDIEKLESRIRALNLEIEIAEELFEN